jgi:alkylation response protein AidB-like acyl-CoA dehydrogenase
MDVVTPSGRGVRCCIASPPHRSPTVSSTADVSPEEFAQQVQSFFDTILPAVFSSVVGGDIARAKAYRGALYEAGIGGVGYPAEFGGSHLPDAYKSIFSDVSRRRIPREDSVFGIGVGMALPVIRDHASAELKQRFLGPGLRGEEIWCQMYSEPGAGSDLAGLQTRAELDGDEWVVTGQKVWTSGAQNSQYAILLARTDFDAPWGHDVRAAR